MMCKINTAALDKEIMPRRDAAASTNASLLALRRVYKVYNFETLQPTRQVTFRFCA